MPPAVPPRLKVKWQDWRRAALQPRMLLLLFALLAVAAAFIRLGAWQLERASLRGAAEAEEITEQRIAAPPVPLESALRLGETFTTRAQLVKVELTGTYGRQLLVPDRSVAGEAATLVVSEFRIAGHPNGAMIPVVRGWLPGAASAAAPPPEGKVTLVGYLSDSERSKPAKRSAGQVGAISNAELANLWGGPTYLGFVVLAEGEKPLRTLPPPSYGDGTGTNWQNLFYAAEWFIFGGFALAMWWRLVRDDAARRNERELLGLA